MTNSDTAPRVRFAPSPTGYLHVGGARTALFNWLFARHLGGKFLLRIEDTDIERSTEESTQQILDSMEWLGMSADEPIEYQQKRAGIHRDYLNKLIETGVAYKCYCTKERLEELRELSKKEGRTAAYDKKCLLDKEWVAKHEAENAPYVMRFAVPDTGVTSIDDMVYGYIEFENRQIGDFVIARQDGTPVYNFVNAVDDIDMGITHICRGEDHVSNTPKQILIYSALGAPIPRFAHLPMILGQDKTRLSKRHGATSVMQFKDQGILPEALVNFIALLGWAPEGGGEEIMSIDDLVARFTLDKVNKSAAVFDYEKLLWMNGMYIRQSKPERIYGEVLPMLKAGYPVAGADKSEEWLRGIIDLHMERCRTLNEFVETTDYFFEAPATYDEKGARKFLSGPEHIDVLKAATEDLIAAWDALPSDISREEFNTRMEERIRAWAEQKGIKLGQAIQPIRLAVSGKTATPGLFDVLYFLGKDEFRRRVDAAAERVGAAAKP